MPLLSLQTNQAIDESRKAAILAGLSGLVAEILGKPESYVMVVLQTEQAMSFAQSLDPCAYVQLKSLGLPEAQTPSLSKRLCQWISAELQIPESRIYIEFSSPERHMWGWDGRTFG